MHPFLGACAGSCARARKRECARARVRVRVRVRVRARARSCDVSHRRCFWGPCVVRVAGQLAAVNAHLRMSSQLEAIWSTNWRRTRACGGGESRGQRGAMGPAWSSALATQTGVQAGPSRPGPFSSGPAAQTWPSAWAIGGVSSRAGPVQFPLSGLVRPCASDSTAYPARLGPAPAKHASPATNPHDSARSTNSAWPASSELFGSGRIRVGSVTGTEATGPWQASPMLARPRRHRRP